jgi:hypothetical protein
MTNYIESTEAIAATIMKEKSTSRPIMAGHCAMASFGYWWRDHPEVHQLLSCEYNRQHLLLTFNGDVSLIIKSPRDAEQFDGSLIIWDVESLTWRWKGFGSQYSETNNFYRKYRSIKGNMLVDSREGENPTWHYAPRAFHPALIIAWDLPVGPPGPFLYRYRDRGKERFEMQQLQRLYQQQGANIASEMLRHAC